jgi:hypothetical protein
MKRWLLVAVVVALIAVGFHDLGRHFNASSDLNASTDAIAGWAANNAHALTQQQFASQLSQQAAANETTVTQYALVANDINLWTEKNVTGTWVIGPYLALSHGVPFREAIHASYVIRREKSVTYQ